MSLTVIVGKKGKGACFFRNIEGATIWQIRLLSILLRNLVFC